MIRLVKILMTLAFCTLVLASCVGWVYALARWVMR